MVLRERRRNFRGLLRLVEGVLERGEALRVLLGAPVPGRAQLLLLRAELLRKRKKRGREEGR